MTLRLGYAVWFLLGAASLACGASDNSAAPGANGGQTGEEGVGCLPVQTRKLAWSERSELGFSADEVLNSLGSQRDSRLNWDGGTSTTLSLTLTRGTEGDVEFQQRDFVSDGSGAELAAGECPDIVSIPVTLTFTTGDGQFREQWSLDLLAESAERATAFVQLDLAALEGTFSVTQVDPSRFDELLAHVDLLLASSGWTGTVSGQALKSSGSGANGTSSATSFAIASF